MKRTLWIEGTLFAVMSLLSIGQGISLMLHKVPHVTYDPVGPGLYIIAIGVGLLATGVTYVATSRGKSPVTESTSKVRSRDVHVLVTVAAFALYSALVYVVGYLMATLVFFLIQFRIEGIKSRPFLVIISLFAAVAYYVLFIELAGLIFPRSILFK